MKNYLVDTNILMGIESMEKLLETYENIYICYTVLDEIDNNKTHDGDKGFKARRGIRLLREFGDFLNIVPDFKDGSEQKNDDIIISTAIHNNCILLSNDIGMMYKAKARELETLNYYENVKVDNGWDVNERTGQKYYIEDDGTVGFKYNKFRRYTPTEDILVRPQHFKSTNLGQVQPLDVYQVCAMHSLVRDNITVLSGHAGSGKTLLSLAYIFQQLENQSRRKLIVFTNPTKTKGSDEIGFYKGTKDEKLLQNSIGGILASKLGSMMELERLMANEMIEIHPMSDIRGMEVSSQDIMFITEAQNVSVMLMKLAIQRCQEGCKIIIEGDFTTQVDNWNSEGLNNGMIRLIHTLKDYDKFAHVNLPIIRRSRLAELVDNM